MQQCQRSWGHAEKKKISSPSVLFKLTVSKLYSLLFLKVGNDFVESHLCEPRRCLQMMHCHWWMIQPNNHLWIHLFQFVGLFLLSDVDEHLVQENCRSAKTSKETAESKGIHWKRIGGSTLDAVWGLFECESECLLCYVLFLCDVLP